MARSIVRETEQHAPVKRSRLLRLVAFSIAALLTFLVAPSTASAYYTYAVEWQPCTKVYGAPYKATTSNMYARIWFGTNVNTRIGIDAIPQLLSQDSTYKGWTLQWTDIMSNGSIVPTGSVEIRTNNSNVVRPGWAWISQSPTYNSRCIA